MAWAMIKPNWGLQGLVFCGSTTIDEENRPDLHDYGFPNTDVESSIQREANRNKLLGESGASTMQWLKQVHGNKALQIMTGALTEPPEADACWTIEEDIVLAVLTADCLPIVLASNDGRWLGLVHAGWRGLATGVITNLVNCYKFNKNNLSAWLGPSISAKRYEVGEEVWSIFEDDYPETLTVQKKDSAKRCLDLALLAKMQLQENDVRRLFSSGFCTYEDPRFFSHRRSLAHSNLVRPGRFATVAMLKG